MRELGRLSKHLAGGCKENYSVTISFQLHWGSAVPRLACPVCLSMPHSASCEHQPALSRVGGPELKIPLQETQVQAPGMVCALRS